MNDSPLSVLLIAEAQELARLRRLLRAGPASMDGITGAADAETGLDLLCRDRPDVCLLDAALVQDSGMAMISGARARGCFTPVVVLLADGPDRPETNDGGTNAVQPDAAGWLTRGSVTAGLLQRTLRSAAARHRDYVALQDAALRKSAVIDAAVEAMVAIDRTGRFIEFNLAAERMFGLRRAEAIGRRLVDTIIPPALRDAHSAVFARHLATGEERLIGRRLEITGCRADGSELPLELAITRTTLADGPIFSAQIRDISDRKAAGAGLRAQQLLQAQKMEAVGQLAGGIAHDFNNLLTAILGYSELLLEQTAPGRSPRATICGEIRRAADRAAALTRQLLAFSRQQILQPVRDRPERRRSRGLAEMLAATDRRAPRRRAAARRGPRPDPGRSRPDRAGDRQPGRERPRRDAGRRLADLRHTTRVEGRRSGRPPPGRCRRATTSLLRVSDTGTGMPPEIAARIFEPFFTTKEAGKGTGLGLATVYGIVKQTGGTLSVSSAPGEGSVFELYFPQTRAPIAAGPSVRSAPRGGSETILLVEDESSVRDLTAEVLDRAGYRVLTARDGQRALEIAGANDGGIDLLLTDVVMPGISGRELADRLVMVHPATRVLFMSGYTDDAIVQHGVLNAGTEFLQKPFTGAALAARVRQVLDAPGPAS